MLIPHFNHARQIRPVIDALGKLGLPVIVVDDGSGAESLALLREAVAGLPWLYLHREPENRGKGAAVMCGLRIAASRGFSHAVQVDADGQHRIADIPLLLGVAREHPEALVSGFPVYDETVPGARLHGRKISLFWTRLETWSGDIKDAMCGFRVYPVVPLNALLARERPGSGMEFDAEVLVRAHWAGIPLRFTPTAVTYPADGLSHFRMVRDNVRISRMHTRLFFGMLWRIPAIINGRLQKKKAE
ncbi:MAG: glycosyltransferase family 2 protein [Gammaproteobacteria bacterium]